MAEGRHSFAREGCVLCGACARSCSGALEFVGETKSVAEVLAVVARDKPFYGSEGGLTVSGGEPFSQPEFLLELLSGAKRIGIGTCVETSGFASENDIRSSLPFVDWYLYDCKETDAALHKKWTGVDNAKILANLGLLNEANARVVLRCPIVPGCNDRRDHFCALAEMSRQYPCVRRIEILPYHPLGVKKSKELGLESPCLSTPFPKESDVRRWTDEIAKMSTCPVRRGS